ncbi:MAG TPA: diacylglycerol kinase family protein [Pyrinomonadaceae bacterium]|nr:diacylglycerol kinase family protein [Pyrinomonadaceae bacterium]
MAGTVEVIINAGSGSVLADETECSLHDSFLERGIRTTIRLATTGAEVELLAAEAANGEAEVIVAAGGDGTISTVAKEVHRTGKVLGILPLGTLNNFSKDLGIPQIIGDAVTTIAEGNVSQIDMAEVNGRVFLNNSSIGLYPRMVRHRVEQQRLGYGKWRAAFWAWLRIFRLSPFLDVTIKIDNKVFRRKLPFVFVGNNEYEMDLYNIGRRPTLDEGKLSVYFIHSGGRWGVTLLLLHTLTGRLKQWRDFEAVSSEEVTIASRKKRLLVAFDGEVGVMQTPLCYRSLPKALKVIVPSSR